MPRCSGSGAHKSAVAGWSEQSEQCRQCKHEGSGAGGGAVVCDSCGSARVSAETVSGGSVVAMGVDGKDGIVAGKVGCAQRGRGLKCVRIVSPNPETREGTLLPFVARRGQPVDHGQRVGMARRRCAPRSPERLVDLLLVVVCVEKCGMSLMSSTCRGCGDGAR